jgi:hypothetical protein
MGTPCHTPLEIYLQMFCVVSKLEIKKDSIYTFSESFQIFVFKPRFFLMAVKRLDPSCTDLRKKNRQVVAMIRQTLNGW